MILGGVRIPFDKGLLGHSDADVLIHAVCDALLGAAALGDIGEHFPDTDEHYRGISSTKLLEEVCNLLKQKSMRIGNVDTVVILQEPKLSAYKGQIQVSLAGILGVDVECVGVKAKTHEGLDSVGRTQAVAAYAVAAVETEGLR